MRFVRKSLVIICLIAFAVSTTGISFQIHSCKMSGQTKVALFPEIFGKTLSCCEVSQTASTTEGNAIQKVPCCNNITKYTKVSSIYNTLSGRNLVKIVQSIPQFSLLQAQITDNSDNVICNAYRPPPPKLFGKILLHFIHNIKSDLPA